jgi:hypothetical protein
VTDLLFVGRGQRKFGPFSAVQLRALAASGQLHSTDAIWREGMAKAVLAARVKNLFPVPLAGDGAAAEAPQAPTAPVPSAAPSPASPAAVLETGPAPAPTAQLPEIKALPKASPCALQPEQPRKRRATALRGAVLISQDGYTVSYRKKCSQCGFEDTCRNTLRIASGLNRSHFFCPKCRKARDVQIQGQVQ